MQPGNREGTVHSNTYEAPVLRALGTLHELTQMDKKYGPTDGYTFQGVAITNASR